MRLAALVMLAAALAPAAPPPSTDVCTVKDKRATELSGLVATASGYVAINDGQDDPDDIEIFYLDARCRVTKTVNYPTAARDPEDLAVAPDGSLWVADVGDNLDNDSRRKTVALWHLPAGGGAPVIHRLTYPDGPHDAEALLFTPDGVAVIVTKEISGRSGIYEPAGALRPRSADGVPLKRVAEFSPTSTGIANELGRFGEVLVTGAATSPDRRRVALRTYTAAYEWDVTDGDVVKAIATGTPRVTPLPDEPQGESIAYTPDGSAFLTVSDESGPTTLRRYTQSTTTPAEAGGGTPTSSAAAPAGGLTVGRGIPAWLAIGASVGGLALAALGILGLRRARRRS